MTPVRRRRRTALLLVVLALVALGAGLLAGRGAGSGGPPASATLRLVPADALVAVHVSTDRGRTATAAAAARLAQRLPSWPRLQASVLRRLTARGCGIDLRRRPGRETVFALLPGAGGVASPLIVTDAPAKGLGDVSRPCGALVARRVDGLVVIGQPAGVLAAQSAADGRATSLANSPVYRRAASGLPSDRVADAWVSPQGARRLLTPLGGALGLIGSLLDARGLRGVAAALVPTDAGARVAVRRVVARGSGGAPFRATLHRLAPADTLAYVASGDLASTLQRLVVLAGPGAGRALPRLLAQGGVPLDTLGRLGRESAVVIAPGESGPSLTLLARVQQPARAQAAMRALEPALATLAGAPAETSFADAAPGGKPARTLAGAATTGLTWAIDGTTLIVGTTPAAVADARSHVGRLTATPAYRAVAGNVPNPIRSLVFLDPKNLLQLSEQTGIGPGAALQGVRGDLDRIRAVGAYSAGAGDVSTVDLSFSIP
ncbi:MAG TPA: hypothetical protein VMT10_01310 [Solirubrobacteraceae bacterium]|nr:hypothetical protein [Solirubrobacteraceae bacterium]